MDEIITMKDNEDEMIIQIPVEKENNDWKQ